MSWKEWLTKNLYVTAPNNPDPFFHPRKYAKTREEVVQGVQEVLRALPRWRVVEHRENQGKIKAARAARFLPFEDDVDIYVVQGMDGVTKLEILSRAQGGKGDFGRNKRNVRDFLLAMDAKLPPLVP